jgi:hypothetical protein
VESDIQVFGDIRGIKDILLINISLLSPYSGVTYQMGRENLSVLLHGNQNLLYVTGPEGSRIQIIHIYYQVGNDCENDALIVLVISFRSTQYATPIDNLCHICSRHANLLYLASIADSLFNKQINVLWATRKVCIDIFIIHTSYPSNRYIRFEYITIFCKSRITRNSGSFDLGIRHKYID